MSYAYWIGKRSGDLAGQCSCCIPRRARYIIAAICGHALSCWKSTWSSCQRNGNIMGLTCAMLQALFILPYRNIQMWLWVVTDGPTHHEAWMWANSLQKMTLTRSTLYTWTSIPRIQREPTLISEDNRLQFHSPIESFMTIEYPCLAVLWCKW